MVTGIPGVLVRHRFLEDILRVLINRSRVGSQNRVSSASVPGVSDQSIQNNFQDVKGNIKGFYPPGNLIVAKNISH